MGELRRTLYAVVETGYQGYPPGRAFDLALVAIILVNIAATAMATVPGTAPEWLLVFRTVEWVSVGIFTVEYLVRAWVSVEDPHAHGVNRLTWRLKYLATPLALIDLIAVLPSYVELFTGAAWEFTLVLRVLRLFKLLRFTGAFDTIFSVIRSHIASRNSYWVRHSIATLSAIND